MRRVGQIVGLGPKLQMEPFGNSKCPEQAGIQIDDWGAAQNIAPAGPEANRGNGSEGFRIVVGMTGPDAT